MVTKGIKKQQTQETVLTSFQRFGGLSVLVLKRAVIYQRKYGNSTIIHQDKKSLCFSQQQLWSGIKSDPESSGCRQTTVFFYLVFLKIQPRHNILLNLRMFISKLSTHFFFFFLTLLVGFSDTRQALGILWTKVLEMNHICGCMNLQIHNCLQILAN